jgi:hypothetical protein
MPPSAFMRGAASCLCGVLCALCLSACSLFQPAPPPPPPPAPAAPQPAAPAPPPAPEPAQPQADPADLAARHMLDYHERLRRMSPSDVTAEVTRLGAVVSSVDPPASPDDVLALVLALMEEHNPGDLARAASLLEPLEQAASPEPQPWRRLARLLADHIAEQRRLEDELDRQAGQRRDTQRTIQQLTEKLEALKAIERSMTAHSAGSPPGAAPGSAPAPDPAPPAPKMP